MQGDMASDAERKAFYESARQQAEEDWSKDKSDSHALTRWGGALLELANFSPGEEASTLVDDAVTKFKGALEIDPKKHEALWCLGNAYTSQGFLSPNKPVASTLFAKAQQCFKDAVDEQPDNPVYKKGLEMTAKAPDLYDEIQKQINPPQPIRQSAKSTFWYDVLGYVTVIGAILAVSACAGAMAGAAQKQAGGTSGVKAK